MRIRVCDAPVVLVGTMRPVGMLCVDPRVKLEDDGGWGDEEPYSESKASLYIGVGLRIRVRPLVPNQMI